MVISRNLLLWGPGGTMLGLILGLSLAFLVEMLNDLVRTPSDIRRFLHVPLLGIIPDADEDRAVDDVDLCHVVREAPYSLIGECYRRCRTNLELSTDEAFKTLLVASGQAGRRQDLGGLQPGGGVCGQVREGAADRRQPAAAEPAPGLPAGGAERVRPGSG